MKSILLIGGGGHCRSVIDVVEQSGEFQIAGIIDKQELIGQEVLGYQVIGCDDDLESLYEKYQYAIITVGHVRSNSIRIKLFDQLKKIGYALPTIISPRAYLSRHAQVEEATIVMHGAIINANAKIGKNSIINSNALVEHDAIIEDHCHISTGAIVNGAVYVKANTFFGSQATSKEAITVEGFIKAGSVVI